MSIRYFFGVMKLAFFQLCLEVSRGVRSAGRSELDGAEADVVPGEPGDGPSSQIPAISWWGLCHKARPALSW